MGSRKLVHVRLKVKQVAESKGMNRATLARKADLNYETVHRMWSEEPQKDVSIITLEKLARVLAVPVTDLYEVISDE